MSELLKWFERIIFLTLIFLLAVVVLLATFNLGREIIAELISNPLFNLDGGVLLEFFGFVLLIVIGVELVETIKTYLVEHVVRIEVVLEVALIATVRKVIIVDIKEFSPLTLFAIAALVIALSVGYYLERRARALKADLQGRMTSTSREEAIKTEHHPLF